MLKTFKNRIKELSLNQFLVILILLFITRHVPLARYNIILNLSVVLIVILNLFFFPSDKTKDKTLVILQFFGLGVIFCSLVYSIFIGNEIKLIFRFFIINVALIVSYSVSIKNIYKYVFFFTVLQSLVILSMSISFTYLFGLGYEKYLATRFFFWSQKWGDIYPYHGLFYKIQIKGNALLPFAFMLSFLPEVKLKRKLLIQFVLLGGIIIAGNFAFLIAVVLFYVLLTIINLFNFKSQSKGVFVILLCFLLSFPAYNFATSVIAEKQDVSLAIRSEQSAILLGDTFETVSSFIFGKGLGNTLNVVTPLRDYTGDVYFELQTLYFFNQLGLLFGGILLLLHVVITFILWNKKVIVLLIYAMYILYAFTNPYFLDSYHFVIILILNSFFYE